MFISSNQNYQNKHNWLKPTRITKRYLQCFQNTLTYWNNSKWLNISSKDLKYLGIMQHECVNVTAILDDKEHQRYQHSLTTLFRSWRPNWLRIFFFFGDTKKNPQNYFVVGRTPVKNDKIFISWMDPSLFKM